MRVYVAGPISKGDLMMNLRQAIDAAEELRAAGHAPFIPHLDMFWHLIYQHDYEYWMDWDREWLDVCEALVRLPGESTGSDREVEYSIKIDIPVFYSVENFIKWHDSQKERV